MANVAPLTIVDKAGGARTKSVAPSAIKETLHIVTQSDERYAQHLSATLASLFEHNQDSVINVFVLVPIDISSRVRGDLSNVAKRYEHKINFCDIDREWVKDLRVSCHVTSTAYFKLFMGELIPKNIGRILYLDADTIVRGDLLELWRYDLGNATVGAAPDAGAVGLKVKPKLGLSADESYFNSGVMIVDLNRWRNDDVGSRALKFVRNHSNRMTFNDQCALNWVLRGHWTPLADRWNLQTLAVTRLQWGLMDYTQELKARAEDANIIHFSGSSKPWHYMNNHPLKHEYVSCIWRTRSTKCRLEGYNFRNCVKKNTYRVFPIMVEAYYRVQEWRGKL